MSEQTHETRTNSPSGGNASVTVSGAAGWVALALVLVQMLFSYGLWNRVDLLMLYYRDIKAALLQHGVNPHPHLPTESP